MPTFPQIGVQLVVQGAAQYQQQIAQAVSQTQAAGQQISQAATATDKANTSFGALAGSISKLNPQVGSFIGQGQNLSSGLGGVAEAAGVSAEAIGAIAGPIAVVTAGIVAFLALANRGAGFSDIQNGFDKLTNAAGQTSDVLLGKLHDATQGTISDMQLEQLTNNALIGVNGQLAKSFGEELPQMMTIARNIALATGQDQVQVFDSIEQAIKRGQTRMLTNIGIVIDQKKAYEDYANSIGVSVKSLDKAQQQQAILNAVMKEGTQVSDALGNSQESNASKMERASTSLTNILDNLSKAVQPIFSAILDSLNSVLTVFADIVSAIEPYIQALADLFTSGFDAITGGSQNAALSLRQTQAAFVTIAGVIKAEAKTFFEGGANMIGALAGGIIAAANTYVFPAVIQIANFIADFLSGMSPPPRGPLHTIDQGGANMMTAWLEGITGVSLEPVSQVAQDVANVMGGVANESLSQVKAQLLALDNAIAPFQEQLDLVKGQFDSINNVAKPAIDAIDRQISVLRNALNAGSTTAAAQIKALDEQKAKLQDYVDTQQQTVDYAQIQLALAQAQQGQERAILTTRENQLKLQSSLTTPAAKTPKAKGGKAAASSNTGDTPLGLGNGPAAQDAAQQAGIDMSGAFAKGVIEGAGGTQGILDLQTNEGKLASATARIASAGQNLGPKLQSAFTQPFTDAISNVSKLFDPQNVDSVPNKISTFVNNLPSSLAGLFSSLLTNLETPFKTAVTDITSYIATGKGNLNSILKTLAESGVVQSLTSLPQTLADNLLAPFSDKAAAIGAIFTGYFDTDGQGIKSVFANLLTFFGTLPAKVETAFRAFAQGLLDSYVNPLIDSLNAVLSGIASFVNDDIMPAVQGLILMAGALISIINGKPPSITLPGKIVLAPIAHASIAQAFDGGMFSPGLLSVGERGQEFVSSASPMAVFPNNFVTALDRLTSALTRPSTAQMVNSTTNITNNQTVNMNGIPGAEQAIMEFARLNAVRAR